MEVIIYRDKATNKIIKVEEVLNQFENESQKIDAIIRYNNNSENKRIAEISEFNKDSLEKFLYESKELTYWNFKDAVNDITSALDCVNDQLRDLECSLNRMEENYKLNSECGEK